MKHAHKLHFASITLIFSVRGCVVDPLQLTFIVPPATVKPCQQESEMFRESNPRDNLIRCQVHQI